MLVVDTSSVVLALSRPTSLAGRELASDGDLHAPHLLDCEYLSALGRLEAASSISAAEANSLQRRLQSLAILRYPHEPLADRIWELRHNCTAYDATYIALAEVLGAPLITADERLARAPGNNAQVIVVA